MCVVLGITEFYLFDLIYEVLEKKSQSLRHKVNSKMIRLGKCMSGLHDRCNGQRTYVSTQTIKEKFEDTKVVIRHRNSNNIQYNDPNKK